MSAPSAAVHDALRPFFIIGTERSGSNLLRLVLNAHSRLCIAHPPHVVRFMHGLEKGYGDLQDAARFHALAGDVARLIRWHTCPWPRSPGPDELIRLSRDRTLFGLVAAAYETQMLDAGKARWGCKSTFMIHHDDLILRQYPHARFLLLVRDPRDVAVSARDSVFNHFHPCFVARLWSEEQRKGIRLLETLPAGSVLLLHYEALLLDPAAEVQRVCDFLGERFEPAMLRFFETDEARRSAALCTDWRNTGGGFLGDNAGKFARVLTPAEIAIVEAVAGAEMDYFGYARVHEGPAPRLGACRVARFWLEEQWRKARVEWRSLRHDRNFALRVRKALFLYWLALRGRGWAVAAGLRRMR